MRSIKNVTRVLCQQAKSKWFFPLVLLLALADACIFIVPNEALLITAVLARPKRWAFTVFSFTLASAAGATLLASYTSQYGQMWVAKTFPHALQTPALVKVFHSMRHNEVIKLMLVSITPIPQHWAVVMAGLNRMPLLSIFCSVLLGRLLKYLAITRLSLLGAQMDFI